MTTAGQLRFTFPAWRVYIFGVDVTDDVVSMTINWNDDRTPNISEIQLASPLDRYIITDIDVRALYDDITVEDLNRTPLFSGDVGPTSEGQEIRNEIAQTRLDRAIRARLQRSINDEAKTAILKAKFAERVKDQEQPGINVLEEALTSLRDEARASALANSTSLHKFNALSGDFLRFPFQVGQCVFHAGDAITAFWRDPFRPTDWYFAARGFVADWREDMNESGLRSVVVTVEDPLRAYRHARLTTNWSIFDYKVTIDPERDASLRTFHLDHFPELTLPEVLYTLTFGSAYAGEEAQRRIAEQSDNESVGAPVPLSQFRYGVHGKTPYSSPERGAGSFNFEGSEVFQYGPESSTFELASIGEKFIEGVSDLEEWQEQVDHIVPSRIDDILVMCLPASRELMRAELLLASDDGETVHPEYAMKLIGEHPQRFPVDYGRLLILLPSSLGPGTNRDVLLRDLIQGIATETEFVSRLQIIYNICERIDFSFYATPRGDVVCEMPLFAFHPKNFGRYAERYIFPMDDTISLSSRFSDEHIKTQVLVSWNLVKGYPSIGQAKTVGYPPATATIRSLIPQYGIRPERTDPHGYISTPQAAAYFANVKLAQMNAKAWQQDVDVTMHLGVGPNRPCWFEVRDFIATLRGATNAIKWGHGGGVTQKLQLNYRRGWSGLVNDEGHVYEMLGGRASLPLDYALLFQDEVNESETSTKQVEQGETKKTPAQLDESVLQRNERFVRERVAELEEALTRRLDRPIKFQTKHIHRTPERTRELQAQGVNAVSDSKHHDALAVDLRPSDAGLTDAELREHVRAEMNNPASPVVPGDVVIGYKDGHLHIEYTDTSRQKKFKKGQRA